MTKINEIGSGHPGAAEVEPPAPVLHAGGSANPACICGRVFTMCEDGHAIDCPASSLIKAYRSMMTPPSKPDATAIGARAAEVLRWCDHVERFGYERCATGLDASPHLLAGAARRLVAEIVVGGSR